MKNAILFFVCLSFFSCSFDNSNPSVLPSYTGAVNEVVLVIDENLWSGDAGIILKDILQAPIEGISWNEASLDVVQIPSQAMSRLFETHRNLILVEKGISSKFVSGSNLYSEGQYFAKITYKTQSDLLGILKEYSPIVLHQIQQKEKARIRSKMYFSSSFQTLFDKYGYQLSLPKDYKLVSDTTSFSWLEYSPKDKELISGLFLYQLPIKYWPNANFLLGARDSVLQQNVKGEQEGSFMALEPLYSAHKSYQDDGLNVRSLWKMENAFMGGPSITNFVVDSVKNVVFVTDAFLFNPGKNKRNDLQILEIILESSKKKHSN
jgi:hypothetical protein